MKVWILRPTDKGDEFISWDCANGFVIEAETEEQARELANEKGGDETGDYIKKRKFWNDNVYSTCEELIPTGSAHIVMMDFHAG